jgi:chorismate mutase
MILNSLNLQGVEEKRPLIIAGPCSAEIEDQVLETAKQLASNGVKVFRAGIGKPRTKPGGFEGNGVTALPWLQKVKKEILLYLKSIFFPEGRMASML